MKTWEKNAPAAKKPTGKAPPVYTPNDLSRALVGIWPARPPKKPKGEK